MRYDAYEGGSSSSVMNSSSRYVRNPTIIGRAKYIPKGIGSPQISRGPSVEIEMPGPFAEPAAVGTGSPDQRTCNGPQTTSFRSCYEPGAIRAVGKHHRTISGLLSVMPAPVRLRLQATESSARLKKDYWASTETLRSKAAEAAPLGSVSNGFH